MGNRISRCYPSRCRKCREDKTLGGEQLSPTNTASDHPLLGPEISSEVGQPANKDDNDQTSDLAPVEPVAPPKLVYVGIYDFNGKNDGDLSFAKGEEIEILNSAEGGWWYGLSLKSRAVGYVPSNYIEPVNSLKSQE